LNTYQIIVEVKKVMEVKSDIVHILFCVIVKPNKRHKNFLKYHKVFVYCIISVLKLLCDIEINI